MIKLSSPKLTSIAYGVLITLFAIGFYAFAWQEPGQSPPSGNVPAPINVGSTDQSKLGGLGLGGGVGQAMQWLKNIGGTLHIQNQAGTSNLVIGQDGKVGVGTTTPGEKLEVLGNIKLSGIAPTYKVTNVITPSANSDVATKGYVDAQAGVSGYVKKRIFVTSANYDGNLGGLTGADSKCTDRATAAGLGGKWRALLSADGVSAKGRIGYNWDILINVAGLPVASYDYIANSAPGATRRYQSTDLWDDTINESIQYDEYGSEVGYKPVWTGTGSGGQSAPQNCTNWSKADAYKGATGNAGHVGREWIFETLYWSCSTSQGLYCIEQ